jgi:hypothetical protein
MQYFAEIPSSNHQATHAAIRPILQFCVTKLHSLQSSLATATDNDEILETLAHMQSVQMSLTMLTIALVSEDESIINQAKTLLRSVA